jgi:hypothetical protein
MSEAITLTDFAATFVNKVIAVDLPDMHPAGAVTISDWLDEMWAAAEHGHCDRVARLARMVTDKIVLERQWQAEDLSDG